MKIISISDQQIPGVKLINFERFVDQRGFFTETFRASDFINNELNNIGVDVTVPEDFNGFSLEQKENYFAKKE